MSIETDIWTALRNRAALLTVVPANLIAWPDIDFTKPGPTISWLQITRISNRTVRRRIRSDEGDVRPYLLQIDCMTPLNGGSNAPLAMAGAVAAHFPKDEYFGPARVTKAPDVGQSIPNDTHLQTPVTIWIEAFG